REGAFSGQTVTVCAYSAGSYTGGVYSGVIPCASPVTIYFDQALAFPMTPPLSGGSMLTDSGGNYAYFVPAAYYTECVTGARVTGVCYAVNAMGSGVLTNVANVFTALQTFSAGFSSAGPSTLNGTLTIGATGNTGPLTLGVGALGANLFTGNQTAPAFISSSANPSGTGFLRMATGDFIGMRDT